MQAAPLLRAAFLGRCPRCGEGRLFDGLLAIRPLCPRCGLDLKAHDAGDGPAVFVILILGALIAALAFWVEFTFSPPFWVHILIWPPLTFVLALVMLRVAKAALIAQQYRYRRSEMGL